MARQEEGWPLGLQPLNARVGLTRNGDFSGSVSFDTLLTGSTTSSTDSSSDLDTESTGSFFHDRSITLGSLMGVSSATPDPSRRSARVRKIEVLSKDMKTRKKRKAWIFSLCSRDTADDGIARDFNNPPSLGDFLAVERRAANENRRHYQPSPDVYGPDEIAVAQPYMVPNTLFVHGLVAPPRLSIPRRSADGQRKRNGGFKNCSTGCGVPTLLGCISGQSS